MKAAGTWELYTATASSTDITQINTIHYTHAAGGTDHGVWKVGALGTSYSVRNKYIYSVKLYKNNVLERDLVPGTNGEKSGLIDLLSGTFYPTNNTASSLSTENSEMKIFASHIETNELIEF